MTMIIDPSSKTPKSTIFDDIYFSKEDGLGESLYNFFEGNNLPQAWQDKERFTICELGLGTGLNIVLAIDLFLKSKGKCKKLNLISIEKYPLTQKQVEQALSPWKEHFSNALSLFFKNYPLPVPAVHAFDVMPEISVTFIYDDVISALEAMDHSVDCWFLDGFDPSKNPEMWSDAVMDHMARLSVKGTNFATFTAAGFVRRGLENKGFNIEKEKGFGRKRERIKGVYVGDVCATPNILKRPKKVAVIGAGLAGASMAYHLKQYAIDVDVFEKESEVASHASGNLLGLLNPALTPTQQWKNKFYAGALSYARNLFRELQAEHDIGYDPCGSIHILSDEKKRNRFEKIVLNAGWPDVLLRIISSEEATDIAGVDVPYESVYMPCAAKISPQKLVQAMLLNIKCYMNTTIDMWEKVEGEYRLHARNGDVFVGYDHLVLASGIDGVKVAELDIPTLKPIRGQVTYLKSPKIAQALNVNLCFGGYLSVLDTETLVTGATYDRGSKDNQHRIEDDQSNLDFLAQHFPKLASNLEITGGRAGVRVTTEDYMPYYGFSKKDPTLYYSLAHRSHGVLSSQVSAYNFVKQCLKH